MRAGRTARGGLLERPPRSVTGRAPGLAARLEHSDQTPVVWTQWQTAADEQVCPECGPLNGLAWPEDEGPQPPLHVNCRCRREPVFVTWVSRHHLQPVALP